MKLVSFTDSAGWEVRRCTNRLTYSNSPLRSGVVEAAEIHRIDLLATLMGDVAAQVEQVVLIAEFLAGQDHRNAHGGQLADESQLDAAQTRAMQDDLTGVARALRLAGFPPFASTPVANFGLDTALDRTTVRCSPRRHWTP